MRVATLPGFLTLVTLASIPRIPYPLSPIFRESVHGRISPNSLPTPWGAEFIGRAQPPPSSRFGEDAVDVWKSCKASGPQVPTNSTRLRSVSPPPPYSPGYTLGGETRDGRVAPNSSHVPSSTTAKLIRIETQARYPIPSLTVLPVSRSSSTPRETL